MDADYLAAIHEMLAGLREPNEQTLCVTIRPTEVFVSIDGGMGSTSKTLAGAIESARYLARHVPMPVVVCGACNRSVPRSNALDMGTGRWTCIPCGDGLGLSK